MFARWSIRHKLSLCIALLLVSVSLLALGGYSGVYAYRALVRSVSQRVGEVSIVFELLQQVEGMQSELRVEPEMLDSQNGLDHPGLAARWRFLDYVQRYEQRFRRYQEQLAENERAKHLLGDLAAQQVTMAQVADLLVRLRQQDHEAWWLDDSYLDTLRRDVQALRQLSFALPKPLLSRMDDLASQSKLAYRTWFMLVWVNLLLAVGLVGLLVRLVYLWIFRPLRVLFHGSRQVAGGDFSHRIDLATHDEMAELAGAINRMTARFREVRDDLDRQVQERTREVVRSEQLASVGFLAAGVAHEINNPLASIAMCAESLEDRLHDIIQADDCLPDSEHNQEITILRHYLRMIQDEAFRCKEITDSLLDFSRLGDVERHETNLTELIESVIEMVGHLGKYKEKHLVFQPRPPVHVRINPQEWKQVVLNLITNGLDSLDPGGTVWLQLQQSGAWVTLSVRDNGCGMTEEVQKHLFEPFFTRRRDGQGTGLGMSITYRIVSDHGGNIRVESGGPGHGSEITITLPTPEGNASQNKGLSHHYHAA